MSSGVTEHSFTDERSFSIREFCVVENFSPAYYFKMRLAGHGPKEMRLPGSNLVRISPEARREWHERLEKLATTEAVATETAARVEKTSRAGRKGAASPAHHCRRTRAR